MNNAIDLPLWHACQRIAYPTRSASDHPPFLGPLPRPNRMPASWLYHKLAANPELRFQVLSRICALCGDAHVGEHATCDACVAGGKLQ